MTGWTWDYVEEHMTLPRLKAMHEEWKRTPPLAIMMAACLGIRPPEEGTADELIERILHMEKK